MIAWVAFGAGATLILALFLMLISALIDWEGVYFVSGYVVAFCGVVLIAIAAGHLAGDLP